MTNDARTLSQHKPTPNFEFAEPIIKETNEYNIPLTLLRQGLTVIVPVIPGAQAGDGVNVTVWSAYGLKGKYFTLTDPGQDHEVRFEPEDLLKVGNAGDVQYLYFGNSPGASIPRYSFFEEAVPTPELKEYEETERGIYRLPSDAADSGIHVRIRPYENMAVGDRVTLVANATSENTGKWLDYDVIQSDISHPLEFTYDAETLKDLRPGTIHLSYTLSRGNEQYQSRPITIELLPLLPDPQPVHAYFDAGWGHFPPIFEDDGSGAYAPVVQRFGSEPPLAGDQLMLVIHSSQPHSYVYPLNIDSHQTEVLFKIPVADYYSLQDAETIHMATLWRRSNAETVVSSGQNWSIPAKQAAHSDRQALAVSKKR